MRASLVSCSLLCLALGGSVAARADTCSTAANLVSNCGFETGSFAGWTGSTTMDSTGNFNGVSTIDPYQGSYAAYLGAFDGTTTLTQTLSTVAGQKYTIDFALDNTFPGSTSYPDSFAADFGSSVLLSETNAALGNYTLYSFTATATGATTNLSFISRNDAGYFDLDDVSVVPAATTPEPSSLLLMGSGLLGALGAARRRLRA